MGEATVTIRVLPREEKPGGAGKGDVGLLVLASIILLAILYYWGGKR